MILIADPVEFEWDEGNQNKNWQKHGVSCEEAEQVFSDNGKKITEDVFHSGTEARYIILGKTEGRRLLYLVFTIRKHEVRVISARDVNKKERKYYEEKS